MTQTQNLHTRAMLVSLNLPTWSARKYDKAITEKTNRAEGMDPDAGRYNKNLLPGDAPSYERLVKFIMAVRIGEHYRQTLPWSDDGWRLLPVANLQSYTDAIRTAQHEYNRLLDEFEADYPTLRENARVKLNGNFSPSDYPTDIRSRFGFTVKYSPVPVSTDFRLSITADEMAMIAQSTEARVKAALMEAQTENVKRLADVLQKMQAKLMDPKGIFRDSLVGNVREVCELIPRLNLTDDPKLAELCRAAELLAVTEPQTLRDVPEVRIDTANQAQSILDAMTATYGASVFGGK